MGLDRRRAGGAPASSTRHTSTNNCPPGRFSAPQSAQGCMPSTCCSFEKKDISTIVSGVSAISRSGEAAYPSLIATNRDLDDCLTVVNEEQYDGDLLLYYVCMRETYPLLFDAKLVCLLLACVALTMGKDHGKEACA